MLSFEGEDKKKEETTKWRRRRRKSEILDDENEGNYLPLGEEGVVLRDDSLSQLQQHSVYPLIGREGRVLEIDCYKTCVVLSV